MCGFKRDELQSHGGGACLGDHHLSIKPPRDGQRVLPPVQFQARPRKALENERIAVDVLAIRHSGPITGISYQVALLWNLKVFSTNRPA